MAIRARYATGSLFVFGRSLCLWVIALFMGDRFVLWVIAFCSRAIAFCSRAIAFCSRAIACLWAIALPLRSKSLC
jgi:putative lipase involved disintegration of autophagic bodies